MPQEECKKPTEVGTAELRILIETSNNLLKMKLREMATANELGVELAEAEAGIDSIIQTLMIRLGAEECACLECHCEPGTEEEPGEICKNCVARNAEIGAFLTEEEHLEAVGSFMERLEVADKFAEAHTVAMTEKDQTIYGLHEELDIAKKVTEGDAETMRGMQEQLDGMMTAANVAEGELIDLRKKMAAIDDLAEGGKKDVNPPETTTAANENGTDPEASDQKPSTSKCRPMDKIKPTKKSASKKK
jgi:hypothetical protein